MTTTIYSSVVEPFEPRARPLIDTHPQDDGTDDDNLASSILSNTPKLFTRYNSYSTILSRNEEFWTIREVANGEEQLYARGKCVYWTRNSLVIKSFNFTDQVVRAFWSRFDRLDHVCVALVSGLSIFDPIGQHFQILLPFAYQEMYSTELGLIIERHCDPSQDSSLPVMFALTHPTREVSPIIFKPTTRTSQHTKVLTYSAPNFMTIVSCHDTLPLCLMYNSHENQHSIWRIRKTTNEEVEEFNGTSEESTMNTFHQQSSCSFREGISHNSLNLSSKHMSSLLQQSNHSSSATTINFSPKLDLRSRKSVLGNLAASRLGAGCNPTVGDINVTANLKSFNSAHTFNTMSTPNKNRIINYLRDNMEEPILPELLLEQVWSESSSNSQKGSKFFSTTDLIGDEFMAIVISTACQIKVIKCDKPIGDDSSGQLNLTRASVIAGFDAAPITSMRMMVIVDINKNFALYSGFDRLAQISIPQLLGSSVRVLPSSSPASFKQPSLDMSPITMSSARKRTSIGDRSSIGSEYSFNQIFQTLSPVPHASKHESKTSSPVTFGDAKKIEHVIGQSIYMLNTNNQRSRIEIPTVCQTSAVKRLLDAIKLLVTRDLGLYITSKWYQTRRGSGQPELMSAQEEMNLFKNWFLSCLGVEGNLFDSNQTSELELSVRLVQMVSPTKKSRRAREVESNQIIANVHTLLYAMHLVLEDLLLVKLNYDISYSLAELLLVLSCLLKLEEYQGYYWLKFPSLQEKFGNQKMQLAGLINRVESLYKPNFFQLTPPSVVGFISNIITMSKLNCSDDHLTPYPNIVGATNDSFTVVSLFCEMFQLDRSKAVISISPTMPVGHMMKDVRITSRPGRTIKADEKVVELMVELGKDRNYLSRIPEGLNLYLWDAILNCREAPPTNWSEACFNLIGRMDLVDLVCKRASTRHRRENAHEQEDNTLKLLFPDDIRVSEAHRMLASDAPVEFSIIQRQSATEEESREEIHRHLYLLNVRHMAMPVGRGAMCLRTYSPVIGESFEVPRLELSGRALTEDRPIEYNHDITVYPWPFFHNGVSAGLTMCAASANNIIDSTWINYNRPRSNIPHDVRDRDLTAANINNEHAGFLFALGLNGHLEKLSLMALHDYLCQNNDLTKLAILLGMSAAKRGTKDTNIIKVLSIHVDALLPPNSTELDVSAPVHAASIIGVGLLYQGLGDSHISRVLLEEIGRLPGPETNSHIDRESYSLSAGLAFGLVNLCRGGSSTISSSDQLRLYMLGGRRKPLTVAQKDRYFKQDCHRGEEEYINTHITSPGGTLGLGLMYHKTSNESVANWMRAPDTQTLLEYVRPDFLILRMLSYGLIMWDEIQPTEEYINSQIPKIVSTHAFQKNTAPTTTKLSPTATNTNSSIDYELIDQAYCNIVTGCCMAIAMRYAGTADKKAYKTIYKHTKMLIAMSNKTALVEQAGRPCIESCLNVLVTSLAVVMAGTGDLGVMRVCRYLRSRLTQSCVFYGSYMAVHLSLGILFLGACRYSLSASPESIAALVCALYPIYPNHSSDNRYHLQALRHLYVLAVEPRLLIPRDILTNKPVYVSITVKKRDPSGEPVELKLKAPCLMPEIDTIDKVCIDDERYWHIEINDKKSLLRCLLRDHGYLSVKQKAHSSNNQLVQNIESHILENSAHGVSKCRKASALSECVKEDRVEQYSALNELLTRRKHQREPKFKSLLLEQIRLATTLADTELTNKINLLQPIIGEMESELMQMGAERAWIDYITNVTDWTNTSSSVADYINLNDLKCSSGSSDQTELLKSLKELSFGL